MVIASRTCWLQLLPIFSILDEHILKTPGDNFVHFQFLILGPKSSIGTQSVKYQTSERDSTCRQRLVDKKVENIYITTLYVDSQK